MTKLFSFFSSLLLSFSFLLLFSILFLSFPCVQQREKVAQEHCVNKLIGRIQKRSATLLELYEDKDG